MPPTRYLTITKKNAGGSGDVTGPASAVASNVAVFSGTTGKLLADGGGALPVKATGAEINTGTDDAKFATAKAIADSLVVKGPASAPTDSHVALFDGVTGKLLKDGGALPSAFAWGTSVSGTTDGGLSLTLSNSSADGAAAIKLTAGNTQANQSVLANLQLGTSGNVMGLLIQGTGGTTAGAAGTGLNHLTAWGDVANDDVVGLSIGNGSSYTERIQMRTSGQVIIRPDKNTTGNFYGSMVLNGFATNQSILKIGYEQAAGTLITADLISTASNPGTAFFGSLLLDGAFLIADSTNDGTGKYTTGRTNDYVRFKHMRIHGDDSVTDDYKLADFSRDNQKNGTGTTVATGSVVYAENLYTQTSGTLTDTVDVLKLVQNASSTGYIINALQGASSVAFLDKSGNLSLGSAAIDSGTQILQVKSGTAPTGQTADSVSFYSSDISAGNTEPSFYCEGTAVLATGQADSASSVRVKMRINGTEVTLLAI